MAESLFSCALDSAHLWSAKRYVERNPVRSGMHRQAWKYRGSSAALHCGETELDDLQYGAELRKHGGGGMAQYGKGVEYILLLCGYFDTGYLGYSAAEGIDWVWEHRLDELEQFGV